MACMRDPDETRRLVEQEAAIRKELDATPQTDPRFTELGARRGRVLLELYSDGHGGMDSGVVAKRAATGGFDFLFDQPNVASSVAPEAATSRVRSSRGGGDGSRVKSTYATGARSRARLPD